MCNPKFPIDPTWAAIFLLTVLDYFLGKTKKVESNSILELILKVFMRRKK
jgi:hypothetical protein